MFDGICFGEMIWMRWICFLFFWVFLLLGTKHLHVLQWAGRSSGHYIVQFLPCPQVTWDTIPPWVTPIYHKKRKSFNLRFLHETLDGPPLLTYHLVIKQLRETMPRDPHYYFRWDSQFWVAQDYVHNFGFKLHENLTLGCDIRGMWEKRVHLVLWWPLHP